MAKATEDPEGGGVETVVSHHSDEAASSGSAEPSRIALDTAATRRPEPVARQRRRQPKDLVVVSQISSSGTKTPFAPWIGRFVALPPEIQIMILSYLDFGDVERLRRTCRFLRTHISKPMMRAIFADLPSAILNTCRLCLKSQQSGVVLERYHPQYPFSSKCVRCLAIRGELMVDTKYSLACGADSFICRLCGYPVIIIEESDDRHFHTECHSLYLQRGLVFYLVGFVQAIAHIVATALCWAFYDGQAVTLGCTTGIFFMAIWGFLLFYTRKVNRMGQHTRTWHWSFLLELAMLGLWIVIVLDIAKPMNGSRPKLGARGVTTLTFVAMNLIIRTLNSVGFLLMLCEIKYWRRVNPDSSRPKRFFAKFLTVMYIWTYPDAVYQQYPAFWFKAPPLMADPWQPQGPVAVIINDPQQLDGPPQIPALDALDRLD